MAQQAPTLPPVKRGNTLLLSCLYRESGLAVDVTALTIRAQVRDASGALIEELVITKLDQVTRPGEFTAGMAAPVGWPAGIYVCDIKFTAAGVIRSTQTFRIQITEGETE